MTKTGRLSVAVLAAVLAAPAATFFFAAIGRSLQPTTHEPSRTLDALVTWFLGLGPGWLIALIVVLPVFAVLIAAVLLWNGWTTDPALRADVSTLGRAAVRVVQRPAFVIAALVLAFGAIYFAAGLVHAIAG